MPQPIDFQTELSRVAAVERLQMLADRLAMNAQQRLAQEIQEQRALAESQVDETNPKSSEVDEDLKRRNPYAKRREERRRKRRNDEQRDEQRDAVNGTEDDTPPHRLDVTV